MKYIYIFLTFPLMLSFTACDFNFNWPQNCKNTCPQGQELKSDCTCYTPKKAPATELQQREILQALAQGNEQALTTMVANIDANSTFNLDVMQDPSDIKRIYANNMDISNRLDYQKDNLNLITLLAPLSKFNNAFAILLENGANPNLETFAGLTPLQIAISADQGEKVDMLLKAGAQINFEGGENNILMRALNLQKYNALYALANFAKEKQIPFKFPSEYFTIAMVENNSDLANAVLPLTDSAVINTPNSFGVLPLVQAAFIGNFDLMDNLIKNGANLEMRDANYRTPVLTYLQEVYIAQIEGNFPKGNESKIAKTAQHFLEKGANALAKDNNGEDIMFYAVRGDNKTLIETLLVNYKHNINTKNNQGETPLFTAAQNAPALVPFLIAKGANPRVMDANGRTPAIAAVEMGNMDTYDFLENAAASHI